MNRQTKDYRDFIRKFAATNFPFKDIIKAKKSFTRDLFGEFLLTEPKPDPFLYTSQFFTERQISDGFTDAHERTPVSDSRWNSMASVLPTSDMETRLNEIHRDFWQSVGAKTLDQSFYSFDFDAIGTVVMLRKIDAQFTLFQQVVFKDFTESEYIQKATSKASEINRLLDKLSNQSLADEVRSYLTGRNDNTAIVVKSIVEKQNAYSLYGDKYADLKPDFNYFLNKQKPAPATSALPASLTERERALIHCYKDQPPILRGQPLYNDYRQLMTPNKRISYSNDSSKKAKSLIESIERVKPYLTDIEQKAADSEIATIQAKFS